MLSATLAPSAQNVLCTFTSLAISAACQRPFAAPLPRRPGGAPANRKAVRRPTPASHLSILRSKDKSPAPVFRSERQWHLRTVSFVVAAGWPASAWYSEAFLPALRPARRPRRPYAGNPPVADLFATFRPCD